MLQERVFYVLLDCCNLIFNVLHFVAHFLSVISRKIINR